MCGGNAGAAREDARAAKCGTRQYTTDNDKYIVSSAALERHVERRHSSDGRPLGQPIDAFARGQAQPGDAREYNSYERLQDAMPCRLMIYHFI